MKKQIKLEDIEDLDNIRPNLKKRLEDTRFVLRWLIIWIVILTWLIIWIVILTIIVIGILMF